MVEVNGDGSVGTIDCPNDGDGQAPPTPPAFVEQVFPHGGRIQLGESMTPEGHPTTYFSLQSGNCPEPSVIFWVDGISHQPLITLRSRKDSDPNTYEYRTYPLDRIMRNPVAGNPGHPFIGG